MIRYAAIFFIIAVAAFIVGFLGNLITATAMYIGKILFVIFFGLFIASVVMAIIKRRKR